MIEKMIWATVGAILTFALALGASIKTGGHIVDVSLLLASSIGLLIWLIFKKGKTND